MDCHTSRPHCRWSIRRISGNWWRMIYTQGMTCSVGHYAIKGKGLWPCRPFAIIQFYLLDSVGIFRLTRLQSEAVWLGMPQSTKYVSDNIRCVSLAFLKCMSSNQYANTDTHTHTYIYTHTCSELSLRILLWNASDVQKTPTQQHNTMRWT